MSDSPTTEEEARILWVSLEESFADDGGTGISEEEFVEAVAEMQTQFALVD